MDAKYEELQIAMVSGKIIDSKKKKRFWHIDKDMLPFKMHFFFLIGGMGAILPYESALAITRLGLTASNLAAAYTAVQILLLVLKPCIGYLVDYFNRLKTTIIGLIVVQMIVLLFIMFIPRINVPSSTLNSDELNCDICSLHQDFQYLPSLNLVQEDILRQSCFQYSDQHKSENVEVRCSEHKFEAGIVRYNSLDGSCNSSLHGIFPLHVTNFSTSPDEVLDGILVINSLNSSSENFNSLCFATKHMYFLETSSSPKSLYQHCYGISISLSVELQNQVNASQFKILKCNNSSEEFISESKSKQNPLLSFEIFKTFQFWIFSLCLIGSCTCTSTLFTLSDTACYESVHGVNYGRQRAWGAISWGLFAPFAGYLIDYTDSYMASWYLMVFMYCVTIWNLTRMNLVKPDFTESTFKDIKFILSSAEFLAFEVGVFMNGMFTGIIWFYLTWFLTTIGGNKLVIGLAHAIECFAGEMPVLFVSGWMIRRFGHFNIVSLALICYAIRFFAYSYLHNPWWVLPFECLHGFTYGSFYAAMTSYGKLKSKPGTEATTQSILCTTYEAGAGVGCVISGICFDNYGGHTTFFYAAFLCLLPASINMIATLLINLKNKVVKSVISE